ncbi:MAG TPA: undecaprenyl-diphosphatase UppP [Oscillospiraceae bacterium]|nr:undecaprenyl-diphosphatase UppP [Oscillospiraceae bacterium]
MGSIEAIILGVIQGLTEFLPVSSSGHLVIFQDILGVQEAGITFEVMLHFGTLLSVIWVFGGDILRLATSFRHEKQERNFVIMLLFGIIPTGIMGVLLKDLFERFYNLPILVGIMLLITGVILFTLSRLAPGRKNELTMTKKDALLISVAQGIAIIPGISRSGSTITSALWLGLDQETAVRFSFLVSIPVILGATLLELKDLFEIGFAGFNNNMIIGTAASFFAGIFAIRIFVNILQKGKFHYFAYYCWFAGVVTILYKLLVS